MNLADLELPAVGERFRLERRGDLIHIIRIADGADVGGFEVESADDGLLIRSLCIEKEHRSYGAGSEAARLFNQSCAAAGVRVIRAWAPPELGLSAYFWIRMGFQPRHGEGPDGGIWFERVRS